MTMDNGLYPMRWPCGPLEVALRRRLTPAETEKAATTQTNETSEGREGRFELPG